MGKGSRKGKGAEGGSVMKQMFRDKMAKQKKGGKGGKKTDADLGSVGVSKENKDLVLDVLKNIREDVDEKVEGLEEKRPVGFTIVDNSGTKELNGLRHRGIPRTVAATIVKNMPNCNTQKRLWPAVRKGMEALARDEGGGMTDEATHDPEDLQTARDEEMGVLEAMLEPGVLEEKPDGTVEVRIKPPDMNPRHAGIASDLRVIFKGCKSPDYPSHVPLATFFSDSIVHIEFTEEVNQRIWKRLVTDLVGQPVIFEIFTEMETQLPGILNKHFPEDKDKKPCQASATKGGGYRGGGAKGSKGGGKTLKPQPPVKKHGGLLDAIKSERGGDKSAKVLQLFPELSDNDLTAIQQSSSGSGGVTGTLWPGIERDPETDEKLRAAYETRVRNKVGLLEQRRKLPAAKQEAEIVKMVRENQVVLVTGETGCGKTTQVPQFILDSLLKEGSGSTCRIVCTQPRRIAATSIARRVAAERGDNLGNQVGYSIRLETRQSLNTRLLFCTTGVLLRKLQQDSDLSTVSHVVVDEVHERSLDSDFLLIFLKDLINRRPDLKVILMSASVNADLFSEYFNDCPVTHIPGFTHPVEVFHLEDVIEETEYKLEEDSPYAAQGKICGIDFDGTDGRAATNNKLKELQKKDQKMMKQWETLSRRFPGVSNRTLDVLLRLNDEKVNNELILLLIQYICFGEKYRHQDGAVLVFLPGMQEINQLYEELTSDRRLQRVMDCHRLHSSVSNQEQEAVFNPPRKGLRKIVLSTNIAETSVTIDDIIFVVDAGKHKENRYDAAQSMVKLVQCWVSQANAKQRKGRAGRVRPGYCFRMFTSHVHDKVMATFQDCEMTRVPLQNLLLQIRVLNFGNATDNEVLQRAIESPDDKSVKSCRSQLQDIGALGPGNKLTSLGIHLANLPMDPKIGKLLLHGVMLRCLDPCLTIAAALQSKTPFVTPFDRKLEADQAKLVAADKSRSDHIAVVNGFNRWLRVKAEKGRGEERIYCDKHFLSIPALGQIQQTKRQYFTLLVDQGLIQKQNGTTYKTTDSLGEPWYFELGGKELNQYSVHSQAIKAAITAGFAPSIARIKYINGKPRCFEQNTPVQIHPSSVCGFESQFPHPLISYYEKVMTTSVFLRDATMITPQMLMLFAVELEHTDTAVTVNKWISFSMDPDVLSAITELRRELQKMLAEMVKDPDMALGNRHSNIIAAVMKLLREERVIAK